VESFPRYVGIVRKRGPQPYWTPVAPLHRVVSFPLSYLYCWMGLTPLAVTLWGLLLALAGVGLMLALPLGAPYFWVGVGLLNLGVIHDACDGEVARYRIHHGLQSPKTYRVGIFADFWAYAILVQALIPATLGAIAWRRGTPLGEVAGGLGLAAAFILLASYVAGFARKAYWPGRGANVEEESLSLAAGGPGWLRLAQRAYFYTFETAMFTTHATVLLVAWWLDGGDPWWAEAYVLVVGASIALAFLVGTIRTFQGFDAEA
jgi:hypothetical protein